MNSSTPPSARGSGTTADGRGGGGEFTAALASLKDVAGIAGSFVFTTRGELVAREIHAMFDDAALAEAAQRLTRLHDTFAAVGDQLDLAVIRFQDHKLYLKVLSGGMLCILADGVVNMAALRMAASLVGRRISNDLEAVNAPADDAWELGATAIAAPASAGSVPGFASGAGVVGAPGDSVPTRPLGPPAGARRFFRGRPVE